MFGWVLVEQLGVPLPSSPILITAGTLTATHHMGIGRIVLAAMSYAKKTRYFILL